MKKILVIFGTRPEAIKMAPLVKEFLKFPKYVDIKVCVTAQHREMLDQVLNFFEIIPDFDLDLMRPNQDLFTLTSDIILALKPVLESFKPDFVFVHGDTTTSMSASIAAYYVGASVCHIEAGLRSFNKWSPFPEEMNRQITGRLADFHFAPTETSKKNLIKENIAEERIFVSGNTVVDALLHSVQKVDDLFDSEIEELRTIVVPTKKLILVTGHRRENHGEGFIRICEALKLISKSDENVQIIYPVHLKPNVSGIVHDMLSGISNIHLILPLAYPAFVWLMNKSYLILTDSGGIQEEAPSLGKPVLVMRDTTERPEAVQSGTVILVGTEVDKIVNECNLLLNDVEHYKKMSLLHNPYGDGKSCERIVEYLISL